ncbi:hypothetical protein ACRC6Q_15930 [Planococcus sp. SE5232]
MIVSICRKMNGLYFNVLIIILPDSANKASLNSINVFLGIVNTE